MPNRSLTEKTSWTPQTHDAWSQQGKWETAFWCTCKILRGSTVPSSYPLSITRFGDRVMSPLFPCHHLPTPIKLTFKRPSFGETWLLPLQLAANIINIIIFFQDYPKADRYRGISYMYVHVQMNIGVGKRENVQNEFGKERCCTKDTAGWVGYMYKYV